MRRHPKNPHIGNHGFSRLMIFFTRHRIPFIARTYQFFFGCDIGCALPKTVFLPHLQGIVMHENTRLGDDVVVGHQVTLGGRDLTPDAPVIEDGVYIGAGAKILGKVCVGRGATVGANAVVTRDVPPNMTVVGANRLLPKRSLYALD